MTQSLPDGRPVVTQAMIEAGLRGLGLRAGDIVIAHSALRSFGWVEGREDAVIDALIAVVGPAGAACMPALSWGNYGPDRPPPPFDPRTQPCNVGRIPERFRQRPGVRRSLHPTHSVAAIGGRAEELLRDHDRSPTPCGPDSPWGRIARNGGYVLMIGVGTQPCTMFHGPEEEAEADARCTLPTPCRIVTEEGERTVWLRLHQSYEGAVQKRAAMEGVLEAEGLLRRTKVGNSALLLIEARGLWDVSLRLLRAQPGRALVKPLRPGSTPEGEPDPGRRSVSMKPAKVGFGSASMEGVLAPVASKVDDIMTQTLYLNDGDTEVAWIMQDCYNWSIEATTFLREVIARRTGIPVERIVIQTSENHANHGLGSTISRAQAEFYAAPMAASVKQAMERAQPAYMAAVVADVGSRFSIRRRKYINDDLGVLSFWHDYKLADGKADATDLVREAVACLCAENPSLPYAKVSKLPKTIRDYDAPELHEPIYYEDPVDQLVHLLVFRDTSGQTLGSVIRFSAHVTASEPGARTAGYPFFARQTLEKGLGGTAAFALGPQGDLVPRLDAFGTEQTRMIGEGIARAALDALREQAPGYRPVEKVAFARALASVPLRKGTPLSPEDAEMMLPAAREELAQAARDRAPIRQIKRLVEYTTWLSWVPRFFYCRAGLTTAVAQDGHWPMYVHALAINEVVFAGLVAEAGYLTTKALREEFDDWVLPMSEVNGCINYIAADGDQQNGGYEATLSIVGPLADNVLRSSLAQAVREVLRS